MNSIFFLFYLFATLCLGNFQVGPFSLRVYMNVIMAIYLIVTTSKYVKTKNIKLNNFIYGYWAFIVFTILALLINGDFLPYGFSKLLLANYFPAIVLLYATRRYVIDENSFKKVLVLLLSIALIDCIVTILQSNGLALGMVLANLFNNTASSRNNLVETIEGSEYMMELTGYGFAGGVFGYAFANSLFLSSVGILSFYFIKDKRRHVKVLNFIILLTCTISCFLTQERVSIILMLLAVLLLILFFGTSEGGFNKYLVILGVVGLILAGSDTFSSINWGRTFQISFEEDSRTSLIWPAALNFLQDNFLLGGPAKYYALHPDLPPHNLFLNSFILSGAIGGIIICIMFIRLCFVSIDTIIHYKKKDVGTILLSFSVLIVLGFGLFHNASIHNGQSLIILLIALLLIKNDIKTKKI